MQALTVNLVIQPDRYYDFVDAIKAIDDLDRIGKVTLTLEDSNVLDDQDLFMLRSASNRQVLAYTGTELGWQYENECSNCGAWTHDAEYSELCDDCEEAREKEFRTYNTTHTKSELG